MTTTLITGANKGLGHEAARRLIALDHDVWVAARDPERGAKAARELGARFVQLDVTEPESIAAASETVSAETGLDVLVNNAGIVIRRPKVSDVEIEDMQRVFDTNVFGIVRVTQGFIGLLEKSASPVIVNVSSGMGSMGLTSDPDRLESTIIGLPYQSSKAAQNMLTWQYSKAYPEMRINAVDPGQTPTDMTGNHGPQTIEQGTDAIVKAACFGPGDPTGTFIDRDGNIPW